MVRRRFRSILVAAYLLLCILMGGSAQGVWTNLALQILGIAMIAWAALDSEAADEGRRPGIVYILVGLAGAVVLLQLIPIPASLWTGLPGRSELAAAVALAGQPGIALPVSQAPHLSVMTLIAVIPGLALFVSAKMLRPSPRWLALAIAAAMTLSIALGALQVAGDRQAWTNFYRFTSPGAVGVFANVNHMGTLLLVTIPFAAALLASWKIGRGGSMQAQWMLGISGLVLVAVGIALNGSLAAVALSVPVLVASASLAPAAVRWRKVALPVAGLALAGGIVLLASSPLAPSSAASGSAETSIGARQEIWRTTSEAIADTFPVGTGLGSFEQAYRQYENQADVTHRYVNHAHNDYLELVLELGLAGLVLILLFLGWWVIASVRIWTSPLSTPFERAATIASAAILAHSIVDYPLRTAAIAAIFGISIALMTQPLRAAEAASAGPTRPVRHVKLG